MNYDELEKIILEKANGDNSVIQNYYQLFYFERVLERLSKSKYKDQIILRGGLLLTSIVGINIRTTEDIDATLNGIPFVVNDVENIFNEILNIDVNDGVVFQIMSINDIKLEDKYGGFRLFRLNVLSKLGDNQTYVTIEVSTGDVITPKEITYNYKSIFDDKEIIITTYPIETMLSEKFQTIVARGSQNTRIKDFYDIYILINAKINELKKKDLIKAIKNTFKRRETEFNMDQINNVIDSIKSSKNMKKIWKDYVLKHSFVKNVEYEDTINSIEKIVEILKTT